MIDIITHYISYIPVIIRHGWKPRMWAHGTYIYSDAHGREKEKFTQHTKLSFLGSCWMYQKMAEVGEAAA